jgi:hypothetical protein
VSWVTAATAVTLHTALRTGKFGASGSIVASRASLRVCVMFGRRLVGGYENVDRKLEPAAARTMGARVI